MSTEQKLLDEYFEELELQGKLTLKQFTEYFPSNHRRYSQVDTLYRQYLQWRQDMIAAIKSNIAGECNRNGLENAAVIHPLSMGYIKVSRRLLVYLTINYVVKYRY
ncbi:hypothetical protein BDF19DRAFT_446614 [Syncephalis fuscata]|nr:hypothetical protein BDF19DRAFT_446614 [Syncephalis fuscata]